MFIQSSSLLQADRGHLYWPNFYGALERVATTGEGHPETVLSSSADLVGMAMDCANYYIVEWQPTSAGRILQVAR